MAERRCGTCKHYEAAPMWKKGWCRNPLLYSPQQSHLVAEEDLDCNRGMGSYWEPLESELLLPHEAPIAPTAPAPPTTTRFTGPQPRTIAPASQLPGPASGGQRLAARHEPSGAVPRTQDTAGRPAGSRRPQPGRGPAGREPLQSAAPEGYAGAGDDATWGDYLRRSYPVIGIILLLGAFWVWSSAQLARRAEAEPTPVATAPPSPGQLSVIVPSPTAVPDAAPAPTPGPPPPGVIAPGASVVVSTAGDGANIRQDPTTSAAIVTAVANGTALTITGTQQEADGYTWWPVRGDGFSGWVAETLIEPAP